MSREQQTSKNYFQINKGLNTEFSEIGFQDGFTTDEANYELLIDGSRRRRKGLAVESGAGAAKTVDTLGAGYRNQSYLWTNVDGNPDKSVYVFRTGDYIYFADADSVISDGWASGNGSFVELTPYRSDDATDALVQKEPLTFSQGRGHLFVSGPYILPFYVSYDAATGEYASNSISIFVRDYSTIEDGTPVNRTPDTLTEDHRYNLRNRGWSEDYITEYYTDNSSTEYPARNMTWYKGFKRSYGASIAEFDGTRAFDGTKLKEEGFGASSAPVGALFLDPTDTTTGYTPAGASSDTLYVENWTVNTSTWEVTMTITGHGLVATDTFTWSGVTFDWETVIAGETIDRLNWGAWGGKEYTVTSAPDANTFKFTVSALNNWQAWIDQYKSKGYLGEPGGTTLSRSSGTDHGDSWRAVEFHAGRVFYAGMTNSEFNDWIMFSQIADETEKYGKCYQEADPTDENYNSLTPADGGYMVIPGLGTVDNMVSVRNSLIVLSSSGVWEITGGRAGVFTADGYVVRKITETPSIGAEAHVAVENTLIFGSPEGLYGIGPNQYTGILESQSISEFTIQTLWNDIPETEQERMQFVYDSSMKRVYMMYGPNGTTFAVDTMLIYDARVGAIFKYTFHSDAATSSPQLTNNVLMTGLSIGNADTTSNNEKMKFIYEVSTTSVQVADFNQTSFDDWDGTNGPMPYMYTGWDNLGDFQRRRQAPVITVFQKRTETGFTESGGVYTAVNPSSTLMSGLWDWTRDTDDATGGDSDEATTNKVTATQEVYRHVRAFAPSATTDLDGYPVVVTRNKLRGRGRVLQLKFEGATDKDSHILGFTINYKISRRK